MKATMSATNPSKTTKVLKPRFIPRFVKISTTGVIAIPSNQASNNKNRKSLLFAKAHSTN